MSKSSLPESREGWLIRRAARRAAVNQKKYPRTLESTRLDGESTAKNIGWQLRHGNSYLQRFAAEQVILAIREYGSHEDPSGTYGRFLAIVSAQINRDLGDLINARQDVDSILAVVRSKRKKR